MCREPPCLITEYCSRGSLNDVLAAARRDPALAARLTWRQLVSMALDASRGMLYLHTRTPSILHRDLKVRPAVKLAAWLRVADFTSRCS